MQSLITLKYQPFKTWSGKNILVLSELLLGAGFSVLVLGGNRPSSMKTLVASTLFLLSMASSEKIILESSKFLLGASLDSGTADSVVISFTVFGASVVTVSAISVGIFSPLVPSVATASVVSIGWSVLSSFIGSSVVSMTSSVVSSPDPSSSDMSIPISASSTSSLSTGISILSVIISGLELTPGSSDSLRLGSSLISFSETLAVSIDVLSSISVSFVSGSSSSSHITFITFLLTFFGTVPVICLHSSCGTISHFSLGTSSQIWFSAGSTHTSLGMFLQSLMGMSLHTSSSTKFSLYFTTSSHSSNGLVTQESSTGTHFLVLPSPIHSYSQIFL